MEKRPKIKSHILREVRQRCGFGCIICGHPIYEYEHMEGYANVKRHVADEITLLCNTHHAEKTKKLMPDYIVKEANKKPFNLRNTESNALGLYYYGNEIEVMIGNVKFLNRDIVQDPYFIPILINNTPIIYVRFEDNNYLLNVKLYDKDDNLVLWITDNTIQHILGFWDIEFVGRTLTLRERKNSIFIEIEFKTPNILHLKRGSIYHNGYVVKISEKNGIYFNHTKSTFSDFAIYDKYGFVIGENDYGATSIFMEDKT